MGESAIHENIYQNLTIHEFTYTLPSPPPHNNPYRLSAVNIKAYLQHILRHIQQHSVQDYVYSRYEGIGRGHTANVVMKRKADRCNVHMLRTRPKSESWDVRICPEW